MERQLRRESPRPLRRALEGLSRLTVIALSLVALTRGAHAAPAGDAATADSTHNLRVQVVRATSSISIDGSLEDQAWQTAPVIGGFKQRDPVEGAEPSQKTEVRLLYDDQAVYIGARMYDTNPDSIVKVLARRDGAGRSDYFQVYLDPYYDRRTGYFFGVNAAGTLFDGTIYNDGWTDNSWDGVWEGRSRVDQQGWTVEMRIPFSQMRFVKRDVQLWGIDFYRSIARGYEDDYLVYQPKKESGFVSRFPTMEGLSGVSPGNATEFLPYYTTKAEYVQHTIGDPFNDGSRVVRSVGADLRQALGQLTLNATVNPDFGQVEVDPAVVNLRDVETFFPEKRPFFVDGSSTFDAGQQGASDYWSFNWNQPTFFYSRRVGHAPQGSLPADALYSDVPGGTTILGAAKLIGKLGGGNFGMLNAVTEKEEADVQTLTGRGQAEVEPLTYYGVGRYAKEYAERRHGIGVLGTLTARQFGDLRLEDEFNKTSGSATVDGWHFFDKNQTWVMSGWAGGSIVNGNAARMLDLQTNSRHYFQRPDAKSYSVDSSATSLEGYGARLWLNKQKGSWLSNSAVGVISPGYEINDLGFLNRTDQINAHAGVGYQWTTPTKHVRRHNWLAAAFTTANYDGNVTDLGIWAQKFWWFTNNWVVQLNGSYTPETVNPTRSRGGPLMKNAPSYNFNTFNDTDGSRIRYYFVNTSWSAAPDEESWYWEVNPGIRYKPWPNLSLELGPDFTRSSDGAFFLDHVPDPTATETYGTRYIFSRLDQTTFSANIRLNVSFTPAMSLQFFGQPLVASGKYRDMKELAHPNSLDFIGPGAGAWTYDPATAQYDPDGPGGPAQPYSPDFNIKSLRGNMVFRWEYRPGSAFYLVWTQNRTDDQNIGEFHPSESWNRLVNAPADNIFLAKLTYYLNH